jgi:F0F1-type ATP synthase assembly protein I
MEATNIISDGQALLIIALILLGGLMFGLVIAYLSDRYPFNKK